jgi:transposase-like protein
MILGMTKNSGNKSHNDPPHHRSAEEKLRIVMEASRLTDEELGAFMRKEGIHENHLETWRQSMLEALRDSPKASKGTKIGNGEAKRIKALEWELRRKDKALAETAALLVLKKKAQEIWGDGDDGMVGKNDK